MQLFYGTSIENDTITLTEAESLHCAKVLRMKAGEKIHVTDGMGHFYTGVIEVAHDKRTSVNISEVKSVPKPSYEFHLYVALTKHADRIEWMLEKCVELGISSFTPIVTQRTEKKNIRVDRLESTVLSAAKQSLKAWLPKVNEPLKFTDAMRLANSGNKYIAHCADDSFKKPLPELDTFGITHIFIGPEGDFTPAEVEQSVQNGFTAISLGESRLRTETAGLAVCNWMYWSNIKTQ